jgi:hypothetical protein
MLIQNKEYLDFFGEDEEIEPSSRNRKKKISLKRTIKPGNGIKIN